MKTKAITFLKANRFLICCFFVPFLIFVSILAYNQVFPFGNKTLLYSDLSDQFIGFISELARIYKGEGSLFYTFHSAGGINFFATFVHYCSSPLYLILVFFPENRIIDAITLIILLEISLSGLTFGYFLGKRFNCSDSPVIIPFAVFYAFISYSIAFYFLFSFHNAVILLPLVCWQLEKLITKNQWGGCLIIYFLLFVSNYYVGYMAGLFSGLYFILRVFCHEPSFSWKEITNKCLRFSLAVFFAIGLSAPLWLSVYFALRNAGLTGQTIPVPAISFSLPDLLPKFFIGIGDGVKVNLPYVYCGILPAMLCILYFFNSRIPLKNKIGSALLILFISFSFTNTSLNFLWHGRDYPNWFHYRYSFVFSFFLLTCAFESLLLSTRKNKYKIAFCCTGMILTLVILQKVYPDVIKEKQFHINLFFIILYTFLLLFVNWKKAGKILPVIFLFVSAFECFLNSIILFKENSVNLEDRDLYLSFQNKYASVIDRYSPSVPGKFYRVEKNERRTMSNDAIDLGYNGLSMYTSIWNKEFQSLTKSLGITSINYWIRYEGSTFFTDSLFSFKYLFSDYALNSTYEEVEPSVWENPFWFPLFFYSDEDFAVLDRSSFTDPILFQDAVLMRLSNESDSFFEKVPIEITSLENLTYIDSNRDHIWIKNADTSSAVEFEIEFSDNSAGYLFIPQVAGGYDLYLNGDQINIDPYMSNGIQYIFNLFPYFQDGKVSCRIQFKGNSWQEFELPIIYGFDSDRFTFFAERIQKTAPIVQQTSFNAFEIALDQTADKDLLLSSIPFEPGWRAYADGKEVTLIPVLTGLTGFKNIPQSARTLELYFIPPGFRAGSAVSFGCLLLFIGVSLLKSRK